MSEGAHTLISDLLRAHLAGPATTLVTSFLHKSLSLKSLINLEKNANKNRRRGQFLKRIYDTLTAMDEDLSRSYEYIVYAEGDLEYFALRYQKLQQILDSVKAMFK